MDSEIAEAKIGFTEFATGGSGSASHSKTLEVVGRGAQFPPFTQCFRVFPSKGFEIFTACEIQQRLKEWGKKGRGRAGGGSKPGK